MLLAALVPCGRVLAAPSETDVFKSIQDNMDHSSEFDYRPVLLIAAGGGVVVLLLLVNNRRKTASRSPQALNSPARLMKEVLRDLSLNSAQVKQLKLMASAVENPDGEQTNPLLLLLCPSVMAKGLHRAGNKVDRKTVASIVRKMREGKQG